MPTSQQPSNPQATRPQQSDPSVDQGEPPKGEQSPSLRGELDAADYGVELRSIRDPKFLWSTLHHEQHMRAVRSFAKKAADGGNLIVGAHPDILRFEKALVKRMNKLGVPMFASEVIRTPERQTELYIKGTTKAKANQSPHQFGCAVDIIHGVKGWEISNPAWNLVGQIGLEVATSLGIKIKWGGTFSNLWDPAHWELLEWKSIKEDYPWLHKLS